MHSFSHIWLNTFNLTWTSSSPPSNLTPSPPSLLTGWGGGGSPVIMTLKIKVFIEKQSTKAQLDVFCLLTSPFWSLHTTQSIVIGPTCTNCTVRIYYEFSTLCYLFYKMSYVNKIWFDLIWGKTLTLKPTTCENWQKPIKKNFNYVFQPLMKSTRNIFTTYFLWCIGSISYVW